MSRGLRQLRDWRVQAAALVLLLWAVIAGVAVFSSTSDRPSSLVARWARLLHDAGAPGWLATFDLWQEVFNVVMFVPAGFLAPMIFRRRGVVLWLVIGLAMGGTVELIQQLALPHRQASWDDVVTNGFGVALGYLCLAFLRSHRERRQHVDSAADTAF